MAIYPFKRFRPISSRHFFSIRSCISAGTSFSTTSVLWEEREEREEERRGRRKRERREEGRGEGEKDDSDLLALLTSSPLGPAYLLVPPSLPHLSVGGEGGGEEKRGARGEEGKG